MTIRCTLVAGTEGRESRFTGRVGIVIPAFNEAPHLGRLLARCRLVRPAVIVVVDDASTDATPEVLARESLEGGEVPLLVLRNPGNLGKQGAVRRALRALRRRDIDAVALIDGDGQHDPFDLPGLAALLDEHDVVIGARSHAEMPRRRRLSNWIVNEGFRRIAGIDFVDAQSGLRLYRKECADVLAAELPVAGGYGVEHESLAILARHARARRRDLRLAAAPVGCRYGEARSRIRPAHVAQLACDTVRQAVRIRRASRGDDPATAGDAAGRALTVEIHDVSPATRAEVDALREALAGLGVDRTTLLVVPSLVDDEGRRWDLREDERLVDWLHARRADGSEIVQHGLTHRAGDPPPGLCHAVLHSWFSRGGDEFAHVSLEEARDRLREGRAILRACGFEPLGFVAPCWLQSRGTCTALEELGYRFTAFLDRVQPLPGDREPVRTPALTFASANAWVDHGKRVVMRGCEVVARPAPLLRVALHPSDLHGSRPAGHALERLRRLLRYRRLVTYEEWLAARATARGAAA